jgi:hypothetical protein
MGSVTAASAGQAANLLLHLGYVQAADAALAGGEEIQVLARVGCHTRAMQRAAALGLDGRQHEGRRGTVFADP